MSWKNSVHEAFRQRNSQSGVTYADYSACRIQVEAQHRINRQLKTELHLAQELIERMRFDIDSWRAKTEDLQRRKDEAGEQSVLLLQLQQKNEMLTSDVLAQKKAVQQLQQQLQRVYQGRASLPAPSTSDHPLPAPGSATMPSQASLGSVSLPSFPAMPSFATLSSTSLPRGDRPMAAVEPGKVIHHLHRGHKTDPINYVRFNPSGSMVATSSIDGSVYLQDLQLTESSRQRFLAVAGVSFSRVDFLNDNILCGACTDGRVYVWDYKLKKQVAQFSSSRSAPIHAAKFAADGVGIVAGSYDQVSQLFYWDLSTQQLVSTSPVPSPCIDIAWTMNQRATGHFDGSVRLWDERASKTVLLFQVPDSGPLSGIAVNPCNETRLAVLSQHSSTHPSKLSWFDIRTGTIAAGTPLVHSSFRTMRSLATPVWSPDGTKLAVGNANGAVWVWDLNTAVNALENEHKAEVTSVDWHGGWIVSADAVGDVCLWAAP